MDDLFADGPRRTSFLDLERLRRKVDDMVLDRPLGRAVRTHGMLIEAEGVDSFVGELCEIDTRGGPHRTAQGLLAETIGFREGRILLMPFGPLAGLSPGDPIRPTGQPFRVGTPTDRVGRLVDALGRPADETPVTGARSGAIPSLAVDADPPPPKDRPLIREPLGLGVRVLDTFLTCGVGQRLGIFAGSGVGKSTLLGSVARGASSDVNVIALIGERGREVREFIEKDLGPAGLARSIVVASPSSDPPIMRLKAALTATRYAEYFREQGMKVLLIMDSITRLATAQREIGLAADEPPTARGYPPSVFTMLPRLLERAGTSNRGAITALYTVLVDGDDMNDPIADAARGFLDGHVVLSRDLAHRGHYPAIDVLKSVSRVMGSLVPKERLRLARLARRVLAESDEVLEAMRLDVYREGTDPKRDHLLRLRRQLDEFRQQDADEIMDADESFRMLADALEEETE